jgi:hypothetical protein
MSEIQTVVNSLLGRVDRSNDPVILSILQEIVNELDRLGIEIDPPPIVTNKISREALIQTPGDVTDFSYRLTSTNVILEWTAPTADVIYYEIRKGSNWDTASRVVVTANNSIILDPLPTGIHRYLIRSVVGGVYSAELDFVDVVIPFIGNVTITVTQIITNVLLRWTEPSSVFRIDYYRVIKNGEVVGNVSGTFFASFETVGGTYSYSIIAYDIAGNSSPETSISVLVPDPPDFILRDEFLSNLNGTKTNVILRNTDPPALLANINTSETIEEHFINNSWNSPQDQVDTGFYRWLSPFALSGSYQEVFDCSIIYTNVIITLSWSTRIIEGEFTLGTSTRVSDDGITWSDPETSTSFFVASVRYIEVTVDITSADQWSLMEFYNFQVSVSVREEMDSGEIEALAADVGGTIVTFNKLYKFVDSITVSPLSTISRTVIYDFSGGINPTSFRVLLFDNDGVRVDGPVSWKSRGIL